MIKSIIVAVHAMPRLPHVYIVPLFADAALTRIYLPACTLRRPPHRHGGHAKYDGGRRSRTTSRHCVTPPPLPLRYFAVSRRIIRCIWTCRVVRVRPRAGTRRSNSVRARECLLINEEHTFYPTMRHVHVARYPNPHADYLL